MRKGLVVLIILLLAISAGAYVYFYQPFNQPKAIESLLPSDTVSMLRVCELKKQIEQFKHSRLGRSLAGIDVARLLDAMEIPPHQRDDFLRKLETLKQTAESPWLDTLFGQDVAVALQRITFAPDGLQEPDLQTLLDSVTIIARPKQPTRVLESLQSIFATQQVATATETYQQWKIHAIALEGDATAYYTLVDGAMIAGFSAAPVKRCLDQSLNESTSLLHAPAYQKHSADLFKSGKTDLLAFADVADILRTLGETVDHFNEDIEQRKILHAQIDQFRGIETLNLTGYDDGSPLITYKMVVGFDRQQMSPKMTQITRFTPTANPTLKRIPANVLLYSWQNNFDLASYWAEFQENPQISLETVQDIQSTFETNMGLTLEELLQALGTQAGLLINDINTGGMFPMPELALFIEVKQPEIIDQLIKTQASQYNFALQTEPYKATVMNYTVLPFGDNLSPAYTMADGFCTIALNRMLLKTMFDTEGSGALTGQPNFQAVDQGLTAKNNQVFYMNPQGLLDKTRQTISWAMAWMAMTKPDDAKRAQQIITLGIDPLIDGLSMIKAVGGRTYIEDDSVHSDTQVLLDRS
ncbi:MAG: hypothetical protein VR64_14925 [Desulfatitalea sp. BRH_c12]|nr:MAG: hypothetical protein VR64_14925 [Desulfatitalea sp. BRH_c12]